MGGGSKKNKEVLVGYKYYVGVHMVLAKNKLAILALKFGEKVGWEGVKYGGETIKTKKNTLFGGKQAEGGVSGFINVLDGDSAQPANSYLTNVLGGAMSAYRGVTSLVFRQFYFGNNPYLKKITVKVADEEIYKEWEQPTALIGLESKICDAEIYIAIDVSGSMAGARLTYAKSNVAEFVEGLKGCTNAIRIVAWDDVVQSSFTNLNTVTDADYNAVIAFVNSISLGSSGGTNFASGVSLAPSFFTSEYEESFGDEPILEQDQNTALGEAPEQGPRRLLLFISDGAPSDGQANVDAALALTDPLVGVEIWCFNIELTNTLYSGQLDNTPSDGVPVVNSSDAGALSFSLRKTAVTWVDMNPAHILRHILVSPTSGGSGDASIIGDSFVTSANTLYAESFGMSIFWRNTDDRDTFMNDIQLVAGCVVYEDRTTGKWELKLIRDDYTVGNLPVFDTSNVVSWHEDIGRPSQNDLPNQVTLVYTKRVDGEDAAITVTNIAAIQQTAKVSSQKLEFRGITSDSLASRVALRELSSLTTPLLGGTITVMSAPVDLNLGSAFVINNPEFGIDSVTVRLVSREDAGGANPKTTLNFLEDKFSIGADALILPTVFPADDKNPKNSPLVLFEEIGYYGLITNATDSDVNDALLEDPDLGVIGMAGSRPNNFHTSLTTATKSGTTWNVIGTGGFMPTSVLQGDLMTPDVVEFIVPFNVSLKQLVSGSLLLIGTEIMRLDNMVVVGNDVTLTVGRGCLDTAPTHHLAGADVLFFGSSIQADPITYGAGETIEGKALPSSSIGQLPLADATTYSTTLNSRAIRPYPVGNLKLEGEFAPTVILPEDSLVTWAHRDRLTQTSAAVEDYSFASIGPEAGVAYTVEIRGKIGYSDFFALPDLFAFSDFFIEDSDGYLIRTEPAAQVSEFLYSESGTNDVFAKIDFFAAGITDFFDSSELDFFSYADLFDTNAVPEFFRVIGGNALRTQLKVITKRDGYENWTTPSVIGKHLAAAINLTLEAF